MVTPELQAYIDEQRAAGFSTEIIRDALVTAGWAEKDITQSLGPAPAIAATAIAATPSAQATTPLVAASAVRRSPWIPILIAALILLAAGFAYYIYSHQTTPTPAVAIATPTPTPQTLTTATNAAGEFSVEYPGNWAITQISNGIYLANPATATPTPTPSPTVSPTKSPATTPTPTASPSILTQIATASSSSDIIITGKSYPQSTVTVTIDQQAKGVASQIDSSAKTSISIDGFSGFSIINRTTGRAMCEFVLEGIANYFTVSFPGYQSCDTLPASYHTIVKSISEIVPTPTPSPSATPTPTPSSTPSPTPTPTP